MSILRLNYLDINGDLCFLYCSFTLYSFKIIVVKKTKKIYISKILCIVSTLRQTAWFRRRCMCYRTQICFRVIFCSLIIDLHVNNNKNWVRVLALWFSIIFFCNVDVVLSRTYIKCIYCFKTIYR